MDLEKLFSYSPEFVTDRLYLRRLEVDDVDDYFQFASDPLVTTYTLWNTHLSLEDSRNYIEQILEKYRLNQAYHWGIIDINTNKLIGRTGFISWEVNHDLAEIGFALSRPYWNTGIMTEATNEIIRYGFNQLSINRIEGRCNHDNFGSARTMEKLGMSFEGILREQLKIKGQFVDQKMN